MLFRGNWNQTFTENISRTFRDSTNAWLNFASFCGGVDHTDLLCNQTIHNRNTLNTLSYFGQRDVLRVVRLHQEEPRVSEEIVQLGGVVVLLPLLLPLGNLFILVIIISLGRRIVRVGRRRPFFLFNFVNYLEITYLAL